MGASPAIADFIDEVYENTTFNLVSLRCKDVNDETSDKIPMVAKWGDLRRGEDRWQTINKLAGSGIGLRCGRYDDFNVLCVDFDTKDRVVLHGFFDVLNELDDPSAAFYYLESSPHGNHVVLLHDGEPFTNEKLRYTGNKCIIETRGEGGQVRVAPSTGCTFSPCDRRSVPLVDLCGLPVWGHEDVVYLLDRLRGSESVDASECPAEPAEGVFPPKGVIMQSPATENAVRTPEANVAYFDGFIYLRENPQAVVDMLTAAGWVDLQAVGNYYSLQRPGTADKSRANHSVHIAREGGAVTVWSSHLNTPPGESVSPANFLARELFAGDMQALSRAIRMKYAPDPAPVPIIQDTPAPASIAGGAAVVPAPIGEPAEERRVFVFDADGDDVCGFIAQHSVVDVLQYAQTADGFSTSRFFEDCPLLQYALRYCEAHNVQQRRGLYYSALTFSGFMFSRLVRAWYRGKACTTPFYTLFTAPSGAGKSDLLHFLEKMQGMYQNHADQLNFFKPSDSAWSGALDGNLQGVGVAAIQAKTGAEQEAEKENYINCTLGDPAQIQTSLPATGEGLVTALISCGRCMYIQDELQDRFTDKDDNTRHMMNKTVELYGTIDRQLCESATRLALKSSVRPVMNNAALSIFAQGVWGDELTRLFCERAASGLAARWSLVAGEGRRKGSDTVVDVGDTSPSFEFSNWFSCWVSGYFQSAVNNAHVASDYAKGTTKRHYINVTPPRRTDDTESVVQFSTDAVALVDRIAHWLDDERLEELAPLYHRALNRKSRLLTTYALIFACLRTYYSADLIKSMVISVNDVKRAGALVLEEIIQLRQFLSVETATTAPARLKRLQETRLDEADLEHVLNFIRLRGVCAKRDLYNAKTTLKAPLPPRGRRTELWNDIIAGIEAGVYTEFRMEQVKQGYRVVYCPQEVKND